MLLFCNRIKEERKRLGRTQEQVAQLAKITVQSQRSYESGKRTPGIDYLEALDEAGFDTHYLVTGERTVDPALLGLSDTERWSVILAMALDVKEEVEKERGVKFSNENLHALMGYAHTYGTTRQALKAFVDTVFLLAKDLPTANPAEDEDNNEQKEFDPYDSIPNVDDEAANAVDEEQKKFNIANCFPSPLG